MSDLRNLVNAQVSALIDGTFKCYDAAADTINARNGGSLTKGTISKRLAGTLAWPIEDIVALEDSAGRFPVTQSLARRMNQPESRASASLYAVSGDASREAGEAVAAALQAAQTARAGDIATAIIEASEAEEAMKRLRLSLQALNSTQALRSAS